MNHSDYAELTRRLGHISQNADHIRMCFTMSFAVSDSGAIVATSTPNPEEDYIRVDPGRLWMGAKKVDTELCQLLDGLADGWFERNQERADKGLGPTADERELYGAMVSFLSATSVPVEGWGVLYDKTRDRCRTWTAHALSWFPVLSDLPARVGDDGETAQGAADKVTPPVLEADAPEVTKGAAGTPSGRCKHTAAPDRQRFANCFSDEFRRPRPGETESRFDKLCHTMQTTAFTRTEWGRVAYAIRMNRRIRNDRIFRISFQKWMEEFFDIIGLPCPKYNRMADYERPGGTRSFITNCLSL